MKRLFQAAITLNLVFTLTVFGDYRDHKEFSVSDVEKELASLVNEVTPTLRRAIIAKTSSLSVWISQSESGAYRLTFVTRAEIAPVSCDGTRTFRTITFKKVFASTMKCGLSSEQERLFTAALNKNGDFAVVNTLTVANGSKTPIQAKQEVSCDVFGKEDVRDLVLVYFSGFPKDMRLWEDQSN
ncbi:MAG: hypothetical protein Q7Q71_10215 [Verrucomicrobiota bacterium JB023]|nr:hypothetical protein [Verrucomicrobiota bacterium JB023]